MLCHAIRTFPPPPPNLVLVHIVRMAKGCSRVSAMFISLLEQDLKCNYTIAFWELQQSDAWLCLPINLPTGNALMTTIIELQLANIFFMH